jgi:hypothetical protein
MELERENTFTREVLFEKTECFLVSVGKYYDFVVRKCMSEDEFKKGGGENYESKNNKLSDFYVVTEGEEKGLILFKKGCTIIKKHL